MGAENLLTDAKLRNATRARDGLYVSDGGGLRFRLLDPSRNHPRGARLAYFDFKLADGAGGRTNGALWLGTIGEPFRDVDGTVRPFTLADARAARDAARLLVKKGIDPRTQRKVEELEAVEELRKRKSELEGRRTFGQAFAAWREQYLAAHRKDGGDYVQAMFERHVLPRLRDVPLADLRRGPVVEVLDAVTAAGNRRSANVLLALIRQFSRWAMARDWMTADPTQAVSRLQVGGKEKPRQRSLSRIEIVALRDALPSSGLPERLQRAIWVILATGCRVGELSGARKAEFDVRQRVWEIPETKSGRSHLVHLSEFAMGHVTWLIAAAGDSDYLLPGRGAEEDSADDRATAVGDRPLNDKAIAKAVGDRQRQRPLKGRAKASDALVLPRGKWTPHDLRRTMASRMREDLRISSDVVERCLNHAPAQLVGTYQVGELLAERREAFERWGAELELLMRADASNVVELPFPSELAAAA